MRGLFGGGGRQNQGISLVFCLLWGPHGAFLEAAVGKIQTFRSFFVYFGAARGLFEGFGRQNSGIYHDFCLLRGPRKPISEAAVDKIQTF